MKNLVFALLPTLAIVAPAFSADVNGARSYTNDGGRTTYYFPVDHERKVERAGVILITGNGDEQHIVMGVEAWSEGNEIKTIGFQTGRVDRNDVDIHHTAARELVEETGGIFSPLKDIANLVRESSLPLLVSLSKALFVHKISDDTMNLKFRIENAIRQCHANENVLACHREVTEVVLVPTSEVIQVAADLAKKLEQVMTEVGPQSSEDVLRSLLEPRGGLFYEFKAKVRSSSGKEFYINPYYLQVISTNMEEFKELCR